MSQCRQSSPRPVAGPNLLFSLPPEIRRMIYCLLLTHKEGIPIPISQRDFPRRSERLRALKRTHDDHRPQLLLVEPPSLVETPSLVEPPSLFPSILHVCRLIYLEACPLLYSLNTFRFHHPSALSAFRWHSDQENVTAVKQIVIDVDCLNFNKWKPYIISGKTLTSTRDWPCLKFTRVTFDIYYDADEDSGESSLETSAYSFFRRNMRPLEWMNEVGTGNYYWLSRPPPRRVLDALVSA